MPSRCRCLDGGLQQRANLHNWHLCHNRMCLTILLRISYTFLIYRRLHIMPSQLVKLEDGLLVEVPQTNNS